MMISPGCPNKRWKKKILFDFPVFKITKSFKKKRIIRRMSFVFFKIDGNMWTFFVFYFLNINLNKCFNNPFNF